jgi:CAAX protease family protein
MSPQLKRVLLFFLITYPLTWFGIAVNWLTGSEAWPVMNPLGPLMAAPIAIGLTEGRAGFRDWGRRLRRFDAPAAIWLTAFFVPLAIIAASFWLAIATGAELAPLPKAGLGEYFLVLLVVLIAGPLPEEVSFRGFGLARLQERLSPLAAAMLIGFGVIVWHLPLLINGDLPLTVLLALTAVPVVYGWLMNAGGSVWPLVLLHAQLNFIASQVTGPMMPQAADQSRYLMFLGLFYIVWAARIIWRHGPELGRSPMVRLRPMPAE